MSSALLKKSLEIVDGINIYDLQKKRQNQNKSKKKKAKNNSSELRKTAKFTIGQAKKQLQQSTKDRTEDNIRKLLLLGSSTSSDVLSSTDKAKMIKRSKARNYVIEDKIAKDDVQESVFTEEDFKKFEEEYYDE